MLGHCLSFLVEPEAICFTATFEWLIRQCECDVRSLSASPMGDVRLPIRSKHRAQAGQCAPHLEGGNGMSNRMFRGSPTDVGTPSASRTPLCPVPSDHIPSFGLPGLSTPLAGGPWSAHSPGSAVQQGLLMVCPCGRTSAVPLNQAPGRWALPLPQPSMAFLCPLPTLWPVPQAPVPCALQQFQCRS